MAHTPVCTVVSHSVCICCTILLYASVVSYLLNILDTRVRLELARSSFPVDLTLDEIANDGNDGVNRTNKLVRGISFTACQLTDILAPIGELTVESWYRLQALLVSDNHNEYE
jgi:hypothetical protein